MKFVIEIIRATDAGTEVLRRLTVDEISPKRAKAQASQMLDTLMARGATQARVLNHHDEEIYRLP